MRREPDCSDSFPILSREDYRPRDNSLYNQHLITHGDLVCLIDIHLFHHSIDRRTDLVLHLHGNQYAKRGSRLDLIAYLDIYLLDHARHLGLYDLTADRLGTGSRQA